MQNAPGHPVTHQARLMYTNELSYLDETQMLSGDAEALMGEVIGELAKLPAKEVATV